MHLPARALKGARREGWLRPSQYGRLHRSAPAHASSHGGSSRGFLAFLIWRRCTRASARASPHEGSSRGLASALLVWQVAQRCACPRELPRGLDLRVGFRLPNIRLHNVHLPTRALKGARRNGWLRPSQYGRLHRSAPAHASSQGGSSRGFLAFLMWQRCTGASARAGPQEGSSRGLASALLVWQVARRCTCPREQPRGLDLRVGFRLPNMAGCTEVHLPTRAPS